MVMATKLKGRIPLYGVLALLSVMGFALWAFQLTEGLSVTGMNNLTSWGAYICLFMLFVGLSAGGMIVASSASVFNIPRFKEVAKPAILLSAVCICTAGLFILIDLGGIQRIASLFTGLNLTSPLAWDIVVITCYLAINVAYLFLYTRSTLNEKMIKAVSFAALPVAVLVHSVTAWIFGLQIARDWYSAIMAPLFVSSALDSGLALLLIVLILMGAAKVFETDRNLITNLAGILAVFVAVDGFFVICELLTLAYPGGGGASYVSLLATGSSAPFFWFQIIGGIIVPLFILVPRKNREKTGFIVAGSALIIVGVLCKRIWLLFTSFQIPNYNGAPGVTIGNGSLLYESDTAFSLTGMYSPTFIELGIAIGAVSLCVLVFLLLSRFLLCSNK